MAFGDIHRTLISWIIALLTQLSIPLVSAQNVTIFEHLSVNEGLSQSTVYAIIQDQKGFLWFGTRGGGLNRYDGYEFLVMKHDPDDPFSISDNEVISLFEDSQGVLWIGTRNGGLNRYNWTSGKFTRYSLNNQKNLNGKQQSTVHVIFENSEGKIFVGLKNGIAVYNRQEDSFRTLLSEISKPVSGVTSICEDKAGNIYFASHDRLIKYNINSGSTEFLNYAIDPYTEKGGRIIPMLFDSRENLWIATTDGIKIVEINPSLKFHEDPPFRADIPEAFSYIRSIRETSDGSLWFGTLFGLYRFDYTEGSITEYQAEPDDPESLGHSSVYTIFEDTVGALWIGTWSGVDILDPRNYSFTHYKHQINNPNSLNYNYVSSFQEDKEGIWIGTETGGLNYMDRKTSRFKAYTHSPDDPGTLLSNNVKSIYMDSNNDLWVGTLYGGLSLFNRGTGNFTHFIEDHAVYDIQERPGDIVWIGTMSGLRVMDLTNRTIQDFESNTTLGELLKNTFITQLFTGSDGLVWIGTKNDGLFRYDPDQQQFTRFKFQSNVTTSLSSDYVITICEDNQSNIWIGTNNGFNLFHAQSSSFTRYSRNIGLNDNVINGLLPDERGNLWIATNKGLYRYNHHSGNIKHYDYRDGLQSNEFNRAACYKSPSGEMYFGGIGGFNMFSPDQIRENMDIPNVVISDFKMHNLSVSPDSKNSPLEKHISDTKRITLTYKQSSFSFDFLALNYLNPENNRYSFILEGYEDKWSEPGISRSATYMNLDPGNYTFRVIGSNNDDIWNETGSVIDIVVKGPYWSTPLAFIFYVLALIGLLVVLIRIVQYRAKKENELNLERSEKESLRELNRMRLQFFTNISHEFRTPLTLISGPLNKLMSSGYEHQKGYLLGLMKSNVNRMLRLINQLMDFRKLENEKMPLHIRKGNLDELVSQIVLGFEDFANNKMIELKYEADSQLFGETVQWFDEGIIDKVIYNLLSNAFKFTPEHGIIEVGLTLEDQKVNLVVKDTGKGITQEKVTRIFERFYSESSENLSGTGIGLSLSKRLIDLHRGDILVESEKGMGATFKVSIPIGKDNFRPDELIVDPETYIYDRPALDADHFAMPQSNSYAETGKSGQTILIVEDNKELSAYLSDHFSNYNTLVAENGRTGYEIAREVMPDIIISDIMMPEMDGLEFCGKIKQDFLTSHIPVILLTAKSAVEQKIEGLETGADAYVEKPFDSEYLTVLVKNLLVQRKGLREKYSEYTETVENSDSDILTGPDKKFLKIVDETIQEHISDSEYSVEHLTRALNMSRSQLYRKFKQLVNKNPSEYMRLIRLKHAISLLKMREYNVNEIAELSGFGNVSYFISCFKKYYGLSPGKYLDSNHS